MRRLFALLLLLAVAAISWLRENLPPRNAEQRIFITALALPPASDLPPRLGAFRLEGAWRIDSPNSDFGGYSALVRLADGQLLAISDRGYTLRFSPPGAAPGPVRIGDIVGNGQMLKAGRDAEAASYDPASGRIWIAWENRNAITRLGPGLREEAKLRPRAMRGWGTNTGPEAMVRLADGRFIVLAEGFSGVFENRRHAGLLFPGDPTRAANPVRFSFSAPPSLSPTELAELPDGRVLVLLRRVVWPFPARFAGGIVIADPAQIRPGGSWQGRQVAELSPPLPLDNYEGMAVEPRPDGTLNLWLISDDNSAATQRTLLLKLVVDPAALPGANRKARESLARPLPAQR